MSISSFSNQVAKLQDECAKLQKKKADLTKKLAKANSDSSAAHIQVSKATSATQMNSRSRDYERKQKVVAKLHDDMAATDKRIATKTRELGKAKDRLGRAELDSVKKAERDRKQLHANELRRVRELTREQEGLLNSFEARPIDELSVLPIGSRSSIWSRQFDVCLSFSGEQRSYVKAVAEALKAGGLEIFYDADDATAVELWGEDLGELLHHVYSKASRFCLMFISQAYGETVWPTHERKSAVERAIEQRGGYILPVRFDDTEIPGLHGTVSFVSADTTAPGDLAEMVIRKIEDANGQRSELRGSERLGEASS